MGPQSLRAGAGRGGGCTVLLYQACWHSAAALMLSLSAGRCRQMPRLLDGSCLPPAAAAPVRASPHHYLHTAQCSIEGRSTP